MSNKEWDRLQHVYGAYRAYLNAFIDGLYYRDAVTRKQINDFFDEFLPSDTKEQKEAASKVAKKLNDGLILYLQAVCDPVLNAEPGIRLPGYVQDEIYDSSFDFKLMFFTKVVREFLGKFSPDGIDGFLELPCQSAEARVSSRSLSSWTIHRS